MGFLHSLNSNFNRSNRAAMHSIMILLLLITLPSCNVTKKLQDGSYLLSNNHIKIEYPDSVPKKDRVTPVDLDRFIPLVQVPNKRLLGANVFLWMYNLSDSTKNNKFNRFLRRVGEAPVLLNADMTHNIAREMQLYMRANGFYSSSVNDSISYREKKASIHYNIESGEPYIIKNVDYSFNDEALGPIILADSTKSLVRAGRPLSRMEMSEESARITAMLNNLGYYQFSTNNIRYEVDTLGMSSGANVNIVVNRPNMSGKLDNSKIYRIRNIYINTDYTHSISVDTMQYDTVNTGALNFIYARGKTRNLHPDVMGRVVTLFPNIIYSQDEIDYTSANIQNLKFFKTVNILLSEVKTDEDNYVSFVDFKGDSTQTFLTKEGYVDCTILCSPIKRQNVSTNFEASTNSNYTEVSLSVGYGNRNIFKRAEMFNINLTASYDFMRAASSRDSYELGVGTSLSFPRLVVPKVINRYNNLLSTSTTIDLSYSSQRRPDYDRTIVNSSFGYSWVSNRYFNYTFKPLNIGLIQVPWISSDFLSNIENPYLANSYSSQMILGTVESFRYSTLSTNADNTYSVRVNSETSGNFLNLATNILDSPLYKLDDHDYHKFLGIQYSQYIRGEFEFVGNHKLGSSGKSSIVYRAVAGAGHPYGNSASLPFERMFSVGGSNSMRGWQLRTLGPGNTAEPDADDYPSQVGNIRLEANLEGRFPIWGLVTGALFFDVGNIWYNGEGESSDESRFKLNTFYKQLGFNTGAGARLDFGYFVLRVDWGIQLHNPGRELGERWIHKFDFNDTALHFGIGYPF